VPIKPGDSIASDLSESNLELLKDGPCFQLNVAHKLAIEEMVIRHADGWPESIDHREAVKDWGWLPKYDLEALTADLLQND
jgi:hypothetical protein